MGIGTTANAYKLSIVGGGVSVTGAVVAAAFTGDGSGLTNLSNDSYLTLLVLEQESSLSIS